MTPLSTSNDPKYCSCMHTKLLTECLKRNASWDVLGPYLSHFFFSKNSFPMSITMSYSALLRSILRVIRDSSKKEMARVDTGTNIAVMTYEQPISNCSMNNFVRNSVRRALRVLLPFYVYLTVARLELFERPQDALISSGVFNCLLKPCKLTDRIGGHHRSLIAKVLGVNVIEWRSALSFYRTWA